MTKEEQELLELIRTNENPDKAFEIAVETILAFLNKIK